MRYLLILLLSISLLGCKEKSEIINFISTVPAIGESIVGLTNKCAIVPTPDRSYLIGSTTDVNKVLIAKVSERGEGFAVEIPENADGAIHAMATFIKEGTIRYFAAGKTPTTSFILEVNSAGDGIGGLQDLKPFFDKSIGLVESSAVYDIVIDKEGYFLLTGKVKQQESQSRLFLMKLNPARDSALWVRTYLADAVGHAIQIDSLNNYVVAGLSGRYPAIFKMNSSGNLLWNKTVFEQEPGDRYAAALHLKDNNTIFLNGRIDYSQGASGITRFDGAGNRRGSAPQPGGASSMECQAITNTLENGTVFAGIDSNVPDEVLLYYLDAANQSGWEINPRRYTIPGVVVISNIIQTPDEGLVVLCISKREDDSYVFQLLKTDKVGDIENL